MSPLPHDKWFAWEPPTGLVHVVELVGEHHLLVYCQECLASTPRVVDVRPITDADSLTCLWCASWWSP